MSSYVLKFDGASKDNLGLGSNITNNEAEYQALIIGLKNIKISLIYIIL